MQARREVGWGSSLPRPSSSPRCSAPILPVPVGAVLAKERGRGAERLRTWELASPAAALRRIDARRGSAAEAAFRRMMRAGVMLVEEEGAGGGGGGGGRTFFLIGVVHSTAKSLVRVKE